jgi:DNA polymerase I-like protein with 3'-5' exonuclease and polymerase domains
MANLNAQQLPSDFEFLDCLESRPGYSLVYTDFTALEPHVLTEFSQDKRMLSLYGPGAKSNDIYLYFGANTKLFSSALRKYYNPEDPTPEGIKAAKTHCASERQVLKIMVLGLGYNMGAKKLKDGVNLAGFPLTEQDARSVFNDYWTFFKGIKAFEESLLQQYRNNHGYIVNGRGRILTIAEDYSKDIVNRFVQSTGHDILVYYLRLLSEGRRARKLDMRPWLVDEHDATVWEAPDEQAEQVKQLFLDCYDQLNDITKWGIKFSGKVRIGKSLAMKVD